jgi:transcriptional regulator with XRE-family HTH domain
MTPAEFARLCGKSPAVISRILNNERDPAPETLKAIAHALNLPWEIVFARAYSLPTPPPDTEYEEQILHLLRQMSPQEQEEILELLRFKAERQKAAKQKAKSREKPPAQMLLIER